MFHPFDQTQDQSLMAFVRRRWRALGVTMGVALLVGQAAIALWPETYQATAKVLITRTDQRTGGVQVVRDVLPELARNSNPLDTQVELIRSLPTFEEVVSALKLKQAGGQPYSAQALAGQVKVKPIMGTDLLEISYVARTPQRAQQVVEAVCAVYLSRTDRTRRQGVQEGLKLVDQQVEAAQARLQAAESELLAFKRRSGTVALGAEINAAISEMSGLNTDMRLQQGEIARATARAGSLLGQLGMSADEAHRAAAMAQSPRLRALQEQLIAVETSPLYSQGLGAMHPEIVSLNQRRAMLRESIAAEARGANVQGGKLPGLGELQVSWLKEYADLEAAIRAGKSSLRLAEGKRASLAGTMAGLPAQEVMLGRLTREVGVAGEVYQQLLQKREEARLNMAIAPTFAQVVQPATLPDGPQTPPLMPIVIVGGLAAAVGVGVLREHLDVPVASKDLALSLPSTALFAALPALSRHELSDGELVAQRGTCPHYLEALRLLGLALGEHLPGPDGRVVAMTSMNAQEGKSVTMANLAICLTEMGHRVLLVDADLHRGRLHHLFGLPEQAQGLAEVLREECELAAVTRSLGLLHVVPVGGGTISGRSLRLRHQFGGLLRECRTRYDFVLIDLPPLEVATDVVQVARNVDGLLLLSNFARGNSQELVSGLRQLEALRLPVKGLVGIDTVRGAAKRPYYLIAASSPPEA